MQRPGFNERYGTQFPLVSAGMAMVAGPPLVAAVCEAGGLGLLGTGPMPPRILAALVDETRALTGRPFGASLIVETTALGPCTTDEHVEVLARAGVSPVLFFWNRPQERWVARLRESGAEVWINVHSEASAEASRVHEPDALMVQGVEAGGHVKSDASLDALLDAIRRAQPESTLIAAGGIGDRARVAALLARGADAVCVGTVLLASTESAAHEDYKRRLVCARSADTTITRIFGPEWPDVPMRVLRNRAVVDAACGRERSTAPIGRTRLFGSDYVMPPHSAVLPTGDTEGDLESMCLAAGTSVDGVRGVRPVAEIVRELMGA